MAYNEILVLTKFSVPTTTSLESKQWRNFVLSLRNSPGHKISNWGRIEERLECVVLITIWDSRDQLDQFRASSLYQVYQSTLCQCSPLPPEVYEFEYMFLSMWLRMLKPRVSLLIAHFPASANQEKLQNLHQIEALRQKVAVMPRAQRAGIFTPQVSPPLSLWGREVGLDTSNTNNEDETLKVLFTVYFWRDAEKEDHFKHVRKPRGKTNYKLAQRELKDFGVERWVEEHWLQQRLPSFSE